MALRGTLTHRKTRRLAAALKIPLPFALGILETLWHVTAERAPTGAIGASMTDQDIADEMYWDGDAKELIEALVQSGWIDRCSTNRLVIHDWSKHADQSVRRKVARRRETMVSHVQPCLAMPSTPGPEPEPGIPPTPFGGDVASKPTEPDQPAEPPEPRVLRDPPEFDQQVDAAWGAMLRAHKPNGSTPPKLTPYRRSQIARAIHDDGIEVDDLAAGWRWVSTSPQAEKIRAGWKGIDTFLRAENTAGYCELARAGPDDQDDEYRRMHEETERRLKRQQERQHEAQPRS